MSSNDECGAGDCSRREDCSQRFSVDVDVHGKNFIRSVSILVIGLRGMFVHGSS